MKYRFFFALLLGIVCLGNSLFAQEVRLCYDHKAGPNQTDTLQLYLKSTTSDSVAIRGVNLSFAFKDSCANYMTLFGPFSSVWGTFFEDTVELHNLSLTYGGQTYNARLQYGNSDPSLGVPKIIYAPPVSDSAVWVMSLVFEGTCAAEVYPEHESENPVNQLGDIDHLRIDYLLESCLSMPTVLEPGLKEDVLEVWPNPAKDQLFVKTGARKSKAQLRLFAQDGRLIQQTELQPAAAEETYKISLPDLPSGLYWLEYLPEHATESRKGVQVMKVE